MSVGGVVPFGFMGGAGSQVIDLANASYSNKFLDVNAQVAGSGASVGISGDDSKIYVPDITNYKLWQYNLTTIGEINTGVYANKSLSTIGTVPISPRVTLGNDKLYYADMDTGKAYEYNIINGELDAVTYVRQSNVTFDYNNSDVSFNSETDVCLAFRNQVLEQYLLSTPENISTMSLDASVDLATITGGAFTYAVSAVFVNKGYRVVCASFLDGVLFQLDLTTPNDISTASYNGVSFDGTAIGGGWFSSVEVNKANSKIYIYDQANSKVHQLDFLGE